MSSYDDAETSRRDYRAPYTAKHPVPTVQEYKSFKEDQRAKLAKSSAADSSATQQNELDELENDDAARENANARDSKSKQNEGTKKDPMPGDIQTEDKKDTSQVTAESQDPKQYRKDIKRRDPNRAEREVTDPVTHLPVTIRDFTDDDLAKAGKHDDTEKTTLQQQIEKLRNSLGLSEDDFSKPRLELDMDHRGMERTFPPPDFQSIRRDLTKNITYAIRIFTLVITLLYGVILSFILTNSDFSIAKALLYLTGALMLQIPSEGLCYWAQNWEKNAWEDEIWSAHNRHDKKMMRASKPESTKWLNLILGSIWPLINPDLFATLIDTLEDVMQASLPRFVRMISVDDLGQGSEPLRILGIKWLPRGAAAQTVSVNGEAAKSQEPNAQDQSKAKGSDSDTHEPGAGGGEAEGNEQDQDDSLSAGLEAEEGEFVNIEVAFAYRQTSKKRKFSDRENNAHLYMAFYLPSGIKLPVWVELQGLVGTLRARLQLTPDPPFVALCTMTFLGQPKVDISCVPLVKKGLNIMDLPFLSNFVQSAVDAAMSSYVAPKSLTLDLKSMLAGDDFKHDTAGRGVVIVRLKRAFGFKAGDVSIPLVKQASSDAYVSVGWAKFGKPLFSTRVIVAEMHPYWQEETHLVVSHEELYADESLRLQLWDSDRLTADDDLGRIEVSLREIMKHDKSNGQMWDRTDTFEALRAGETMPGRLEWSVGYFTKVRLMDYQVAHSPPKRNITTVEQLKQYSFEQSARKLRESSRDESAEINQLKSQDFDELCTEKITNSVPLQTYPSGILSVQIHQITGLELEKLNRQRDQDGGETEDGEAEGGEGLPDSYCTISINHQRIFKTRTKPKNSKPFFNAGTERFIRDWRNTSIFIAVRDARIHEEHPLLGILHIPLGPFLRSKAASRFNGFFPLTGGIGYGRIRISVVFRSVQLQPRPQNLGWEWGTLEVSPKVDASETLPQDLRGHRIKFRTPLARGKMHPHTASHADEKSHEQGKITTWSTKKDIPLRLPVRNRYSVPLVLEFRTSSFLKDSTPAFGILWLQNIPDEETQTVEIPIFRGDLQRAEANVLPEKEIGEKVGHLKVKLRFYSGLGRWHGRLAQKNKHISQMMEVLQCAHNNGLIDELVGDEEWLSRHDGDADGAHADDTDSDSSASGDDGDHTSAERKMRRADAENADAGKSVGGFMDEIRGYKRHKGQLDEQHRGVMQWKGPRILHSLKNRAEHTFDKIGSAFEHTDRVPDMETEV